MDNPQIRISPQYVKQTDVLEKFPKGEFPLHEVQKRIKFDFENFPTFTVITAPTGTGKSYAFPFPVINSKKTAKGFTSTMRGLIVLPTNALIDELYENFSEVFPQLKIGKITGKYLNELDMKGFKRYEAILDISSKNDLVITNPDIINYAMHGGYHQIKRKNTGRKEFHNLLAYFSYIIFDEYHLYDESQIANIFTLVYLRDIFLKENQKIKYLFVSATPEVGLKQLLEQSGYPYEEIIEDIVTSPESARAIHGELSVVFHYSKNIEAIISKQWKELLDYVNNGKKCLIVFDRLADLQLYEDKLQNQLKEYKVESSTGYTSENDAHAARIKNADIILATNKAEVGVNYGVEYAIMQPGRFYRNFVQRFGRVSRGDVSGKIHIVFEKNVQYNKFKSLLKGETVMDYYSFIAKAKQVLDSKKFYTETVPRYIGEYVWCIQKNLYNQGYHTREMMKAGLKATGFFSHPEYFRRYQLFQNIDSLIYKLSKKYPDGLNANLWVNWWKNYRNTYLTFRDQSKVVEVVDEKKGIELNYSLEWILQYKVILNAEEIERNGLRGMRYTVGDLKEEREKDLQYEIVTIPNQNDEVGYLTDYKSLRTERQIKKEFKKGVEQLEQKNKRGLSDYHTLERELLNYVQQLSETFNKKRLKINSITTNEAFL